MTAKFKYTPLLLEYMKANKGRLPLVIYSRLTNNIPINCICGDPKEVKQRFCNECKKAKHLTEKENARRRWRNYYYEKRRSRKEASSEIQGPCASQEYAS